MNSESRNSSKIPIEYSANPALSLWIELSAKSATGKDGA
jgi:hypothetical protein